MSVILAQGSANVQQVAALLTTPLAYTTVMTTLDRLFKKGLLAREKHDRAFVYSASFTAREIEERRAKNLIQRFFNGSAERPEMLLSCLVDAVHYYDTGMLDQLENKIRVAKQRLLEDSSKPSGEC
jgi:predicted transcriptional regulator